MDLKKTRGLASLWVKTGAKLYGYIIPPLRRIIFSFNNKKSDDRLHRFLMSSSTRSHHKCCPVSKGCEENG
jgi:hypothetical protein